MNLTPHSARRTLRYPLQLPVAIKLGDREIHARSENISLGGILLSSESQIPEGSAVEVAVGVAHLPDHSMLLSARGKVRRLQAKDAGNYAVAIECDHWFEMRKRSGRQANAATSR